MKMNRADVPNYVMNTLCRICAEKSSKLSPIFENEALSMKILKCLSISVNESDHLPLNICESCFFKIDECYILYQRAHKADEKLKELWKILIKEAMGYSPDKILSENAEQESLMRTNLQNNSENIMGDHLVINSPEVLSKEQLSTLANGVIVIGKAVAFEIITETTDEVLVNGNDLNESNSSQTQIKELNSNLEVKENISTNKSNISFKCRFCSCQLNTQSSLSIHEMTHSVEKPFLCDICGKSFKNSNNLRCHSRIHLNIRKKYSCKICNKGFLTNFFLQEHMNIHTGETPYKCTVCGKEFREKVHLRQHKWTHSEKKFTCPICDNRFNRKGNMKEHFKKFHKNNLGNELLPTKKAGEKKENESTTNFICPICNCSFYDHFLLKNHLRSHSEQKKFFCTICGKKFRHSGSLTYHRRAAHTGEKPFKCTYCEEKFSLKSVQKIHERKIHTFEKPYKCSLCSRLFTNSSSLKNHLYVHSKDKLFECDECGKKFSRNSNLYVHKKLHSGDRQFTCDQCGKSYIQKHDMIRHQKVHDPKSKPFFCKYCGNYFSRKKDASKHAMCQLEYLKKNNSEINSAEKILESVTNTLEKTRKNFYQEGEEHLILETVDDFSVERMANERSEQIEESLNLNS